VYCGVDGKDEDNLLDNHQFARNHSIIVEGNFASIIIVSRRRGAAT